MSADPSKKNNEQNDAPDLGNMLGLGGMLGGVTQLLNQLGNLAEKGEQLKRAQYETSDPSKKVTGSFGYSVKFGGESFGGGVDSSRTNESQFTSPSKPVKTSEPQSRPVPSTREPAIETFSEPDCFLVVAEMPGVSAEDLRIDFVENKMQLTGSSRLARYETSVVLPANTSRENPQVATNNGIVEIRLGLMRPSE